MDRHSSSAMFISEIPVRCTSNGEKRIEWFSNLNRHTTARDVIASLLPASEPVNYSLYVHLDRAKQALKDSARIYRVVAKINQQKSSRRLLFEILSKKRVRFADEVNIQTVSEGQVVLSKERFDSRKENFQRQTQLRSSAGCHRSSLRVVNRNLPHSSSESGISSLASSDDLLLPVKRVLETLV